MTDKFEEDHYELLGVSPKASPRDIRAAFRKLAQKYHPDVNPQYQELFSRITAAYDIISNAERRNEYNKQRGYEFHQEINLNDPVGQATTAAPSSKPKGVKIGGSEDDVDRWDNLRAKVEGADLKIGHRMAMTPEEEKQAKYEESEDEAWGEGFVDNTSGGGGLLNPFRKRRHTGQRAVLKQQMREQMMDASIPQEPLRKDSQPATSPQRQIEVVAPKVSPIANRGERIFQFQLSALEAVLGTTREVAIDSRGTGEPLRITFSTPPGIEDGSIMEVSHGWERAKVQIYVRDELWFKIRETDIHMRMPVTLGEALNGAKIRIPIIEGIHALEIPPRADLSMPITVRQQGLPIADGTNGDLCVWLYIAPPSKLNLTLEQAALVVDQHCKNKVREKFLSNPTAEEFLQLDDHSATLLLPITLTEALKGLSLSVPTPAGDAQVEIQSPWNPKDDIILEGHGLDPQDGSPRLPLYIAPMIQLPDTISDALNGAALAVEQHYLDSVRSAIPSRLKRGV